MAGDDFIFPLLPRNTQVVLGKDRDRVIQLQKKQQAKKIAGDDEQDETQHARIEEKQKHAKDSGAKQQQHNQQSQSSQDKRKGQKLDVYA